MRKTLFTVLIFLLFNPFMFAQENSGLKYYIHSGITKPLSPEDFSDGWRAGANLGFGIGKMVSKQIELSGTLIYSYLPFNRNDFESTIDISDEIMDVNGNPASCINISGNIKYLSPPKNNSTLTPYIICRAGLFSLLQKDVTINLLENDMIIEAENKTVFGCGLGIGTEIVMETTNLFFEIGFNLGFTEEKNTVILPLKFGVVF